MGKKWWKLIGCQHKGYIIILCNHISIQLVLTAAQDLHGLVSEITSQMLTYHIFYELYDVFVCLLCLFSI